MEKLEEFQLVLAIIWFALIVIMMNINTEKPMSSLVSILLGAVSVLLGMSLG